MSRKMKLRVPQRDASGRLVGSIQTWRNVGSFPVRRDECPSHHEGALLRLRDPRKVGWTIEDDFCAGPGPGEVVCLGCEMIVDCFSTAMHGLFEGYGELHFASVGGGGRLICVQMDVEDLYLFDLVEGSIFKVLDAEEFGCTRTLSEREWAPFPQLSPDGTMVVFCRPIGEVYEPSQSELWILELASRRVRRLYSIPGHYLVEPAWSPDGSMIVSAVHDGSPVRGATQETELVCVDLSGVEVWRFRPGGFVYDLSWPLPGMLLFVEVEGGAWMEWRHWQFSSKSSVIIKCAQVPDGLVVPLTQAFPEREVVFRYPMWLGVDDFICYIVHQLDEEPLLEIAQVHDVPFL